MLHGGSAVGATGHKGAAMGVVFELLFGRYSDNGF